jgi:hypothetical protein
MIRTTSPVVFPCGVLHRTRSPSCRSAAFATTSSSPRPPRRKRRGGVSDHGDRGATLCLDAPSPEDAR